MTPRELVHACRVPESVQPRSAGLWTIDRIMAIPALEQEYRIGYSSMTVLFRMTMAKMHHRYGESVMEDSVTELRRHLPILIPASGRVLVSGLGLGCVVRGLLAKPEVEHVDVVEIDWTILQLVGPEFQDNPRITLHHGDALKCEWPEGTQWDYAWHDIWSEEESLQVLHTQLIARYDDMCKFQGAWNLSRAISRAFRNVRPLLNGKRSWRAAA